MPPGGTSWLEQGQGGGSRVGSTSVRMWSVFEGLGKAEKTSPNIGIPDILTRPGASARPATLTRRVLRVLTSCSSGRGWRFLGSPWLFSQRSVGKWSSDMVGEQGGNARDRRRAGCRDLAGLEWMSSVLSWAPPSFFAGMRCGSLSHTEPCGC